MRFCNKLVEFDCMAFVSDADDLRKIYLVRAQKNLRESVKSVDS